MWPSSCQLFKIWRNKKIDMVIKYGLASNGLLFNRVSENKGMNAHLQQTAHKTQIYIHSQTMLFNVSFSVEFKPKWRVPRPLSHPTSGNPPITQMPLKIWLDKFCILILNLLENLTQKTAFSSETRVLILDF